MSNTDSNGAKDGRRTTQDIVGLEKIQRTDGVCAACNQRENDLTEIVLPTGFVQLCDHCRPIIGKAISHDE